MCDFVHAVPIFPRRGASGVRVAATLVGLLAGTSNSWLSARCLLQIPAAVGGDDHVARHLLRRHWPRERESQLTCIHAREG